MKKLFITILLGISTAALAQQTEHQVKRGETFASIAAKYGITEDALRKANADRKTAFAGMKLRIPKVENSTSVNTKVPVSQQPPVQKVAARKEEAPVQNLAQEQTTKEDDNIDYQNSLEDERAAKKARRKARWKALGKIFSGIGKALVSTVDGLAAAKETKDSGGSTIDAINSGLSSASKSLNGQHNDNNLQSSSRYPVNEGEENAQEYYQGTPLMPKSGGVFIIENQIYRIQQFKSDIFKLKAWINEKKGNNTGNAFNQGGKTKVRKIYIRETDPYYMATPDGKIAKQHVEEIIKNKLGNPLSYTRLLEGTTDYLLKWLKSISISGRKAITTDEYMELYSDALNRTDKSERRFFAKNHSHSSRRDYRWYEEQLRSIDFNWVDYADKQGLTVEELRNRIKEYQRGMKGTRNALENISPDDKYISVSDYENKPVDDFFK